MTERRRRFAWLPPLTVGASAAIAAEVSVSLLLYEGPGLVRSLTVVLTVAALAFAGGLWAAPAPGPGSIDRLRRRWVFCLVAFTSATLFSLFWILPESPTDERWSQALGLAVLAALPLFTSGSVLGGMAAVAAAGARGSKTGAPAALGAGIGFIATGVLLPKTPLPATVLLTCLVLLSLGGLIFGALLGSEAEVEVREERASPGGVVRVEDRRERLGGDAVRVLLEGAHERRSVHIGDDVHVPWDLAIVRPLMPPPEAPWRVLAVGAGASTLARSLVREHPTGTVDVLERSRDVVEMAREHLGTDLSVEGSDRVRVEVGNIEDLVKSVRARYDTVLVDSSALAPLGGARGLSREARARLVQAVASSGALVWGPSEPEPGLPELATGWARATFDRARPVGSPQTLLVMSADDLPELPETIEGFVLRNGAPDET